MNKKLSSKFGLQHRRLLDYLNSLSSIKIKELRFYIELRLNNKTGVVY